MSKYKIIHKNDIKSQEFVPGCNFTRLITGPKDDSNRFMLTHMIINPGSLTEGAYMNKDEGFYVLNGEVSITIDNEKFILYSGDALFIPQKVDKKIQNNTNTPVELLAIICPSKTSEELLSEK